MSCNQNDSRNSHIEIERKFLVCGEYKSLAFKSIYIMQGYLSSVAQRTVRVRIFGDKAFITIKGSTAEDGTSRFEWEKEIDVEDAKALMNLCETGVIEKKRFFVEAGTHVFEVDEFYGDNSGLTIAEIELDNPQEDFIRPQWIGKEVTGDPRFYNSMLISNPYKNWNQDN